MPQSPQTIAKLGVAVAGRVVLSTIALPRNGSTDFRLAASVAKAVRPFTHVAGDNYVALNPHRLAASAARRRLEKKWPSSDCNIQGGPGGQRHGSLSKKVLKR